MPRQNFEKNTMLEAWVSFASNESCEMSIKIATKISLKKTMSPRNEVAVKIHENLFRQYRSTPNSTEICNFEFPGSISGACERSAGTDHDVL